MYRLDVFLPGQLIAAERLSFRQAADALAAIGPLLSTHPDCERIIVHHQDQRLFAVDGHGQRI